MQFKPLKTAGYLKHCSVSHCNSPVALGLQVEIDNESMQRGVLAPRIENNTWSSSFFTPCQEHIEGNKAYLTNLGFPHIVEYSLEKLQEWSRPTRVEGGNRFSRR